MPNTRKKVIKTVYKDEESEEETGDFSDSGSEAQISEAPSSEDEDIEEHASSADEFDDKPTKNRKKQPVKRKPKFAKEFLKKITKQIEAEAEDNEAAVPNFTVKDLTDADKLLPSFLNLSESDSSDDEAPLATSKKALAIPRPIPEESDSDDDNKEEYTDIWANNSAEIAKTTFMELEKHKTAIEETKATLESYVPRTSTEQTKESNVTDLLALGEEVVPHKSPVTKKRKGKKAKDDSGSELEDWEEVKESKSIPQQGLQLIVELPDSICRKSKKVDVEMMMKRKMNRVKKEHQVFMHKVHVLCWLAHGNYVSPVLNDQEIMAAVLAMVPKGCYPDNRLNMKYVEQITGWYKDKLTLEQDKNENKFRPKAPPLKSIILEQIKKRKVTAKKYIVYIFVAMLRALGLQCRVMFNFVTLPLRPPSSELCSLATKVKEDKSADGAKKGDAPKRKPASSSKSKAKIPQVDGVYDSLSSSDTEIQDTMFIYSTDEEYFSDFENIMQLDGNDDGTTTKTRSVRSTRAKKTEESKSKDEEDEGVSPPKRSKKNLTNKPVSKLEPNKKTSKPVQQIKKRDTTEKVITSKSSERNSTNKDKGDSKNNTEPQNKNKLVPAKSPKSLALKKTLVNVDKSEKDTPLEKIASPRKTRSNSNAQKSISTSSNKKSTSESQPKKKTDPPKIILTSEKGEETTPSKYFEQPEKRVTRKRSNTAVVNGTKTEAGKDVKTKSRTKSASSAEEKSKYFDVSEPKTKKPKLTAQQLKKQEKLEDAQRVSHKDLVKPKAKPKNDVTGDLVNIIKGRIKTEKEEAKKGKVKGKAKEDSDADSDYLPVSSPKREASESDEYFKPTKISPRASKLSPGVKPSTSKKKIDRRVVSDDDEHVNKTNVWCEVFVEELEQWVAVDLVKGKVHCAGELYSHASHPVCYVVGWDNNNYLKDLTRRYVPHWNTVTRKQRSEAGWWRLALQPWRGPGGARDTEEDDALDRMQLEAPLPKSIAEYKNHPLYALKRHLLKFEAIYPPDAETLGFVRNEAVYARECVYVCRSRDTWLKEAKVVKMGEQPYKVVKARPKWDKLSNKLITDKPLEVFGPWQVADYEPPTAEHGKVPRNAYGNVELFKECMLPKGTVHIKLPGLNKVARKLNIDCAPAMTGFDFNGGWSHPVYDGFVVCKEFEELITDAWVKDQEEQERKEREKIELRVYGNWKRLIKGLLIRERLKHKYGFEEPTTTQPAKKKGPRLVVKKNY